MDQAEQLRIIKANNQIRPTARVITVTSGKGGVGKSNMSINLAIQFRKMGKRALWKWDLFLVVRELPGWPIWEKMP